MTGRHREPDPTGAGEPGRTKPQPTNGRPFPGTRIRTKGKISGHQRLGTVMVYEWDYGGRFFPVHIDYGPIMMFSPTDVEIIKSSHEVGGT